MKTPHLITLLAAVISLCACTARREVPFRAGPGEPFTGKMGRYDYSTYAAIPNTPTSAVYRAVLTTIPHTRENAFYGNHAGSGNRGGKPVDAMDEIFRRHDIAYAEARCLRTMQMADAACVEALRRLDTSKMSPEARAFHARSIKFFSSRSLSLAGKPVSSYLIVREDRNCPLRTESDMRALFKLPPVEKAAAAPAAPARSSLALASAPGSGTRSRQIAGQKTGRNRPGTEPPAGFRRLLAQLR